MFPKLANYQGKWIYGFIFDLKTKSLIRFMKLPELIILIFRCCPLNYIATETKVHKASWYMLHYGGPSPKRHYMLSNSASVGKLWRGKLKNWKEMKKKLELQGKSVKYVRKYIDKAGKRRWKGAKSLRSSELLDIYLRCFFKQIWSLWWSILLDLYFGCRWYW